jgi:2-iminobutanoate/2-iminopropanoate deaminase
MSNQTEMQSISTTEAPAAIGPYSQAVTAGKMMFISGQLPLDPKTGEFVEGDIQDKTRRVMENIQAVAKAGNAELSNVVKSTIFLTDMGDFAQVNEIYAEYFQGVLPARAVVQVSGLPKGAEIEMEAILCLP